jgi:A/G-specific adenine glycosylase
MSDPEWPESASARFPSLRKALLRWYRRERRDLPWRRARDPYAIWLSETMLQQTRVDTVIPFYERFLRKLPTLQALAEAGEQEVLALWSGLGYYRRARLLHAAAKSVMKSYAGRLPSEVEQLRRLEGIGAYTAGAVASIAFGRRAAVVDGNVSRVLARLYAIEQDLRGGSGKTRVWQLAEALVPDGDGDPGEWNQALMELGATVCLPRAPKCTECPLARACLAKARGIHLRLPHLSRKPPPVAMRRVSIVLLSADRVLVARRCTGLLFGGLWEPPGCAGSTRGLAARLGVDLRGLEHAGDIVHVLSHRRMQVRVFRGPLGPKRAFPLPSREYDAIETVSLSGLVDRPHASLTLKILEVANLHRRGLRSVED